MLIIKQNTFIFIFHIICEPCSSLHFISNKGIETTKLFFFLVCWEIENETKGCIFCCCKNTVNNHLQIREHNNFWKSLT